MGSWHKLFKSKHCYSFKITLPWMKIWRWWCSSYLHNHGVLLCEKVQCLKCKDTEGIHKKLIFSFLEMRNCVWYLWTCPNEFMNMAITCFHLIQFWWNLDRTQWTEFYIQQCQDLSVLRLPFLLNHQKTWKYPQNGCLNLCVARTLRDFPADYLGMDSHYIVGCCLDSL